MRTPTQFLIPLAFVFASGLELSSPAISAPLSTSLAPAEDPITWQFTPYDALLREAGDTDRNVLIYFWVGGSGQCGKFYTDTLQNEQASEPTSNFLCFSADHSKPVGGKLFERYNITTVPAIRVINSKGEAIDGMNGFADIATFATELTRIAKGEGTLPALLSQVARDADDLTLRNLLAGKYLDLGNQDRHDELQDSIRSDDPTGKTQPGASLLLNDTINAATLEATDPKTIDTKSVYALAKKLEEPNAAFQCWNWLSFIESTRGDTKRELAAVHQAWAHIPASNARAWGQTKAQWMMGMPGQLSKTDKALVLAMAKGGINPKVEDGAECTAKNCTQDCCEEASPQEKANYLQTLAQALYLNDMADEAREAAAQCGALEPESTRHETLEAAFEKGSCEVASTEYSDTRPVWSPNGKQVLFTSNRDGNQELYMANVKKGSAKRLTRTLSNETSGSFGPKGKTIAYNSDAFFGWTIYTMNNKGKSVRILQPSNSQAPVSLTDPSFSPDGKRIAYCTTANGKSEIAVARVKGGEAKVLTMEASPGDSQPTWSSKGDRIVYTSTRDNQAGIFSMKVDGSDDRNLAATPGESFDTDVAPSADGKRILFARWHNEACDIYSMDADGGGLMNLTKSKSTNDRRPQLSPNGKAVLFERGSAEGPTRLWVMDADGSNPHELLQ